MTLAGTADHIVSKAKTALLRWPRMKTDHLSNLEAICKPCHEVKTEAEQRKRKRVKRGGPEWVGGRSDAFVKCFIDKCVSSINSTGGN